ncbi:MAG: hypothetical protein JO072_08595 [Parafilimonas sp.]|nr:hypothetical protein [Parafilimonas sp.]
MKPPCVVTIKVNKTIYSDWDDFKKYYLQTINKLGYSTNQNFSLLSDRSKEILIETLKKRTIEILESEKKFLYIKVDSNSVSVDCSFSGQFIIYLSAISISYTVLDSYVTSYGFSGNNNPSTEEFLMVEGDRSQDLKKGINFDNVENWNMYLHHSSIHSYKPIF